MEKIVSRVELSEDPALPGEILNKAESLFVAFQTGDFPYVLPFNHVWLDGRIYIHCALEGRKIDVLRRDGRVGFSTAVDVCIIREKSTTHFRSLCGTGRVSEVTDTEEKRRALDAISLRFDARCPRYPAHRCGEPDLPPQERAAPQGQGIGRRFVLFGTNWRKGLVLCGESPYIEVVREKKAAPALEPTRKGPSPLS